MKLLRLFPRLAFALALLSIASFCAATGNVGFLLLTGAIAALSWYVTEGPRSLALPRWAANVFIIAASLAVVFDVRAHPGDPIGVLGRFAVWLSLVKLYERKTHRDYAQLLWLTAILMLAGAIVSRDLIYGLALLVYCGLGLYVVLLYQMQAEFERSQGERRETAPLEARFVPPLRPVLGRTVKGQFGAAAAAIGAVGFCVAVAAFLLAPRGVGMGMVTQLMQRTPASKSGFVDEVRLLSGVGSRISDSPTPVFRVRVTDAAGAPRETPGVLYLRGAALDRYDVRTFTWSASPTPSYRRIEGRTSPNEFTPLGAFERNADVAAATADALQLDFTPLAPLESTVFTLYAPIALSTEHTGGFTFDAEDLAITLGRDQLAGSYSVKCDPTPSDDALRALSGGVPLPMIRSTLDVNPRIREEALALLQSAGVQLQSPSTYPDRGRRNRQVAHAFTQYLHEGGFRYTLDLHDVKVDGDPIASFLFDFKRGHCEFFASALAALCRAVDVECRLVTGFAAAEHQGDGIYVVRESNAHAWVEVRTGEFRWETFDPTPPAVLESLRAPEPTLAGEARGLYELFEARWIDGIVGFDTASQDRLQQSLNLDALAWIDDVVSATGESLRRFTRQFGFWGAVWMIVVASAAVVAALIIVRFVRRARRIRRTLHLEHVHGQEYRRLLRQLGFYLDMLDVLRRGGIRKPMWQPPLAFADSIDPTRTEVAASVKLISEVFYRARYGGRDLSPQDQESARRSLQELASSLSVRMA